MNAPEMTLTGMASIAVLALGLFAAPPTSAQQSTATIDRYVAHVSTVPANAGETVGLFVREKLSTDLQKELRSGQSSSAGAVLFVHGSLASSIPVFDLPHKDYSWMTRLAETGFDTFAMEHSGFGWSARPAMDDPCNLGPEDQAIVTPNPLSASCEPSYAYSLTNSQSDWDEIDTVVDYIRELRGVERVSLVGWSRGGPRTAGYAARHPEKVDKLVLLAPAYTPEAPSAAPRHLPEPGFPMRVMTREMYTQDRWHAGVACDAQVEPGVEPIVWETIMDVDRLGATWGPADGVMRVSNSPAWGWNRDYAGRVEAPTLILVGEQDFIFEAAEPLYSDLTGAQSKYLINMECATHYAFWENFHYTRMQDAAIEWLTTGKYQGQSEGISRFEVSRN
jgi:pimeloyl-ACP methyl ester carboxylesterase